MKKTIPLVGAGLLLGVAVIFAWCRLPAPRRLVDVAACLVKVKLPQTLPFGAQVYSWCATNDILTVYELNQGDFQMVRLNVFTGKEQALHALDGLLQGHEDRGGAFAWNASPDGGSFWFADGASGEANPPGALHCVALRADGSHRTSWAVPMQALASEPVPPAWVRSEELVWLPGGDGCAKLEWRKNHLVARVFHLDRPTPDEIVLPRTKRFFLIGIGADNRCVGLRYAGADGVVQALQFKPDPDRLQLKQSVLPPLGLDPDDVSEWALAPAGDRVAWLGLRPLPPVFRWLPRRLAGKWRARRQMALYVSDLDGPNTHEIGRANGGEAVSNLAWLPDGEHVSVIYRESLWTAPVD